MSDSKVNDDYMKSTWTNGGWVIRWISEDEIEITDGTIYQRCTMSGGDFESFLQAAIAQNTQGDAVAYFAADPAEGDFSIHDTLEAARADAEKILGYAQDAASEDGWADEPPQICYGIVLGKCIEKEGSRRPAPEGSEYNELVDYRLTAPVHAERVVEGMVLVPREPTDAMLENGSQSMEFGNDPREVWLAMLTAAPSPGES